MNNRLISMIVFSLSLTATAQPRTNATLPETSLRETALQEISLNKEKTNQANEVSVENSSLLNLSDPHLMKQKPTLTWTLLLSGQQYKPQGTVTLENKQSFDKQIAGQTILPKLEVQARKSLTEYNSMDVGAIMTLDAGYTSQKTQVTLPSGLPAESPQMSTGTYGASVGLSIAVLDKLQFGLGPQYTQYTVSQFSTDRGANFTESKNFIGSRIFVNYISQGQFVLHADLKQINNQNNLSAGFGVVWE